MALLSTEEADVPTQPPETGREGVKMVALWILLVVALVVLTRGRRGRRR
ncbi:hypothetical protein ZOD2009_13211 [Haladaptatus paucihalophilus DX253]|uniref:Uncharacterized protein n=1 Tax=Haladaptatus paucihalophilus DX253 TaxID=797209 RepID=E7QV06_HALPU|nr:MULTISPECIES: hypothetical protein [Haladaptatus]EFW91524.1 hypothetical protein ZOD2009_13211 [Haladaptatus paucihalophilus DX253]SHL25709.1 hypothetical protein SAMN05444342_3439 [Haladaptatus paucihalophilus DX253]